MSLKDEMAADLSIFFNSAEFAESVTYNGSAILAIINRQAEPTFIGDNIADYAEILIKKSDVASPAYQDIIQFDSATWIVENIQRSDGLITKLKIRKREGRRFKA